MNICILKESLNIGGTERSVANISKTICDKHNVCVALYDASQIKYSYSGELVDFNLPPKKTIIGKIFNTFLRDVKLRKLIKKKQIDILYTFTGISNRQTLYKYDVTKIVSARDFGGMSEKYDVYCKALNNSDAMICNSEYTKQFYLSKHPEHSDRVYAVYNYIDLSEIQQQSEKSVEASFMEFLHLHPNTVVSVGRFCREKGFEYLLKSISIARKNNSDIGLVLVGDGDYKERYLDIIKKNNLSDHVYFTGFQKNPYKYMAKCSCYVLSSLSEGFPNVLAEAMALGLPVIAANCFSGPAEILRKDSDYFAVKDKYAECDYGIITPTFYDSDNSNSISELARAITELLSNPECRRKYAKLSSVRVLDFSKEATTNSLNLIFNELIERRKIK